jgi:hypothetical protein
MRAVSFYLDRTHVLEWNKLLPIFGPSQSPWRISQATRAELLAIPTAYTLDEKQVEELINAGHEILDTNTEFKRLLTDLVLSAQSGEDEGGPRNAR